MKSMKLTVITLAAVALAAVIAMPGAAFAAKGGHGHGHGPAKNAMIEVGSLSAYTQGGSATVNGVTVTLDKHTKLVAEDAAASAAGPALGDRAVAFLRWHKGAAVAKTLEFGTVAFAYAHKQFPGKYVSSTGPDPSTGNGTLTIAGLGKKRSASTTTFNTDSKTKYFQNDASISAPPTYTTNERVNVWGLAMTDGSWYASAVNAL